MIEVSDQHFEQLVADAIDALPEKYLEHLKNIAFVTEDDPSEWQRQQLHLVDGVTLFGLYQGVPLPHRGGRNDAYPPDKITIFKNPLIRSCTSLPELKEAVRGTIWHEVAHYYGLDHQRIHELGGS